MLDALKEDTHDALNRQATHDRQAHMMLSTQIHNAHVPVVQSTVTGRTLVDRTEPVNTPYLRQLYGTRENRYVSQ